MSRPTLADLIPVAQTLTADERASIRTLRGHLSVLRRAKWLASSAEGEDRAQWEETIRVLRRRVAHEKKHLYGLAGDPERARALVTLARCWLKVDSVAALDVPTPREGLTSARWGEIRRAWGGTA